MGEREGERGDVKGKSRTRERGRRKERDIWKEGMGGRKGKGREGREIAPILISKSRCIMVHPVVRPSWLGMCAKTGHP